MSAPTKPDNHDSTAHDLCVAWIKRALRAAITTDDQIDIRLEDLAAFRASDPPPDGAIDHALRALFRANLLAQMASYGRMWPTPESTPWPPSRGGRR